MLGIAGIDSITYSVNWNFGNPYLKHCEMRFAYSWSPPSIIIITGYINNSG